MNASAHLVTLFDVGSHAPLGSSLSLVTCHPCTCASLLEFTSLFFYFDLSFTVLSFFFPLLHFELHTELDNLIAMQNLRISRTREVTTPTTSPSPSQVMSPTTWPSASSTTLQVPSPRHTEDNPITAIQKACQSVSRRCLSCSIEQGNLREKEMSTNQLVLVSRETRTVLTASFLET